MHEGKDYEKKKKTKYIIGGVAAAVVLIGAIYAGGVYKYQNKFIPGTKIDGLDISGKSVAEAASEIENRYVTNTYIIKENGKEIDRVTGEELGMKPDFSTYLNNLNDEQNKWSWGVSKFTKSQEKSSPDGVVLDEDMYNEHFSQVQFNSGDRYESENAKIVFEDDKFVVKPEVYGNLIDGAKVHEIIKDGIKKGKTEIEIKDSYNMPVLKADDKKTNEIAEKLNKELDKTITYKISGMDAVVPRAAVAEWLTYDTEGNIGIDDDALYSYIAFLSSEYSTRGKERTFNSTLGGPITVSGGIYGWSIDVDEESEQLKEEFVNADGPITRVPVVTGVGFDENKDDIGDSYVEIDLSNQQLWVYNGGELQFETYIVSGNPNTGHGTPTGVFYIWSKERNRILRGADYATPVSYWMPIDWTGVGLHDAVWQSSFGGSAYLYRGSHGCINLSYPAVAQIYDLVEVGTPVVVYY